MKTKLSFSTIRLLYENRSPYGDLTYKEVVKEILNSRFFLKDYITDLQSDIELVYDDTNPRMMDHCDVMRKSVKELKQLLK